MKKKSIIVTGGSGFIGTNLVNFLIKNKEYNVYNIDVLNYCSVPEKIKNINKNNYFFIKLNLSNFSELTKIIKKVNPIYIFHLAANSHVDRSIDNPLKFINENILSTTTLYSSLVNLIKEKKIKLKKIIYLSTDEVYGSVDKASSEENKLNPNSPYSASKASTDLISRSFFKTFNLPIIIARASNNFGPFQFSEKFIPNILSKFLKDKKIDIYGDGKNVREWIPVSYTCKALIFLMKKGNLGEIYNIGSNNRVTNLKLFKTLEKMFFKYKKIKRNFYSFVKDRPGHDLKYLLNSNKLRRIGYNENYNFELELKKTVFWYINNNKWLIHCEKNYQGQRIGLQKK